MAQKTPVHPADVRGFSRLMVDATLGLTDLVEAIHTTIADAPRILGPPLQATTHGITGLVYGSIRGATRLMGMHLPI